MLAALSSPNTSGLRSFGDVAHVDLAGDGGGEQRGPAFLQQVDGTLGFGGQGVEFSESLDDVRYDEGLFLQRRNRNLQSSRRNWPRRKLLWKNRKKISKKNALH